MPTIITGTPIPEPIHPSQAKYPHVITAITDAVDRADLSTIILKRGRISEEMARLKAEDDKLKLDQMVLMDIYKGNMFKNTVRIDKWNGKLTSGTGPSSIDRNGLIASGVPLDIIAKNTKKGKPWESAKVVDATKPAKGKYSGDGNGDDGDDGADSDDEPNDE